jgi:uncharacterized protein YrrD
MLHQAIQGIRGDDIVARDGGIGSVDDVYFDDRQWAVRYLVVQTGQWMPGQKVLISPASVLPEQSRDDAFVVDLTREDIEGAPTVEPEWPMTAEDEAAYSRRFGWPYYWLGPYLWGADSKPLPRPAEPSGPVNEEADAAQRARDEDEPRLHSGREVVGCTVSAVDGEIGQVEDLLIDDKNWAIADLVIDTGGWFAGKKVLLPPTAIVDIDWQKRRVEARLTRAETERLPAAP